MIGVGASILTASSLIPQLVKLIKEKKPQNISNLMIVVLFLGHGLWIYYGILKMDIIIVASNGFALAVDLIAGFLTIKYQFSQTDKK